MGKRGPKPIPPSERFHGRYIVSENTCWEWQGSRSPEGYGRIGTPIGPVYAHRVSYEIHHGPIPEGRVVDHICNNRCCVNPAHLQAITHRQNVLRGEAPNVLIHWTGHCSNGHDLSDPRHAYRRPDNGAVVCRTCNRERGRARYWAQRKVS